MGLMKKMATDAKRVHRKGVKGTSKKLGIEVEISHPQFDAQLAKIPGELQQRVMTRAVREAAKYVKRELQKELAAHDSDTTGTASKQSQKLREERAKRRYDLRKSIHYRVKSYEGGRTKGPRTAAFVGPRRPDGNHMSLLEFGATRQLWGKGTYTQPPRPIFRRVASRTKRQQAAVMLRTVRRHRFDA